ncbi:MAG: ABC transporter permease [Pseudomonadota bacterium]|nr:ABC transporter permease [Pseudomonadota bacterium]
MISPRVLLRAVARDYLLLAALLILCMFLLGIVAFALLPFGRPDEVGALERLQPPTLAAPFGGDQLGRPILARVVQGLQNTFLLSAFAVLVSGLLGALTATCATYWRPLSNEISNRFSDILFSFPPILLGILVTAVIRPGIVSAMVVIAAITFPAMSRVVRAATLAVMKRDFVVVAEISGVSFFRRVFTHILPNVSETIFVQLVYSISVGMLVESSLSFLGIGVQAPTASLGTMLRDGVPYIEVAPWMVFPAGITLSLAILSVNLLGDGLRRTIDPLGME